MKKTNCVMIGLVLLFSVLLTVQGSNEETAKKGGWKNLLNGKDFAGFSFFFGKDKTENKGTYTMKDGVVICKGRPSGYMYTKKSYSKFTLEYKWTFKRPKGLENDSAFRGNSGCLIHITEGKGLGVWPRSIEVQGMHRQAGLILPIPRDLKCKRTFDKAARTKAIKPIGEWNTTVIDVDGGDMTITLNGTLVSTVSDCELTEGPIGFQSEGAEIHLKDIKILEKQ